MKELRNYLNETLLKPLPGQEAQAVMSSVDRAKMEFRHEGEARYAGVLMLLYQKAEEFFLPLIRRPEYDGVHSGQMAFPGGRMEEEDENIEHTALRETWEEIGVEVPPDNVIGKLTDLYIAPSHSHVTPVVAWLAYPPSFQPDPFEVAGILEVPLSALFNPDNKKISTISLRNGYRVKAPAFHVKGNVIWGATAMMLSELLEVLQPFYASRNLL